MIAALADFVLSATAAAVIVTCGLAGTATGAVYVVGVPLAVLLGATVPQAGEHGLPFWTSFQLTPLFDGSLPTVAVNGCEPPPGTVAVEGETETVMEGFGAELAEPPHPKLPAVSTAAMNIEIDT